MGNNWSLEIPEPTGNAEADYATLYEWVVAANEELKRKFGIIGAETAELYRKIGGNV